VVWLLNGKKLTRKKIEIGLNDNTHVEVLKGLDSADNVVTGIVASADVSAAPTAAGGSPFLPKRGGGGKGR